MLQPLWESRDRYEELKQMDDAVREVSRLCEGLGSTGPTPLGHTTQGASNGAHLSHIDARPDAEVFCPQGAHSMGDTEPWEESVVVHGGSRTSQPLPPASPQSGFLAPMQSLPSSQGRLCSEARPWKRLPVSGKATTTPSHGLC